MKTDAELLRCYVEEKSESAFTELVQRHIGLVYSVALRRVGNDAHLAEDVTQTVFNDLARKGAGLRGRATLGGWLYLSANTASAAVVRSERRRKARELAAHAMHTTLSSPEPDRDWERLRPVIDDAIVELKDEDREAVVLRFFEQRSFAEVGATLRVTDEAARKRVDRALEKLRATLSRRGVTSTAAALGVALTSIGSSPAPTDLSARVAGHAMATVGGAGGGAALGGWLGVALPAAVVLVLGGLAVAQRGANDDLRHELARFGADQAALVLLRTEIRELARRLADVEMLRTAAAVPLPEPPRQAPVARPSARPIAASIVVSAEGTIAWNGELIKLAEFRERLRAIKVTANPEARLHVRTDGSYVGAVTYVIDEVRKAGVDHLTVEGGAKPEQKFSWWWF